MSGSKHVPACGDCPLKSCVAWGVCKSKQESTSPLPGRRSLELGDQTGATKIPTNGPRLKMTDKIVTCRNNSGVECWNTFQIISRVKTDLKARSRWFESIFLFNCRCSTVVSAGDFQSSDEGSIPFTCSTSGVIHCFIAVPGPCLLRIVVDCTGFVTRFREDSSVRI